MIRRKLTRIEVTLDDTKDLDDYFSKAAINNNSLIGLGSSTSAAAAAGATPACASKTPSQLYQLYTKQHYTGASGTTGQQSTLDISIDQQQSSLAGGSSTLSNRGTTTADNYPTDSIGNLIANLTPTTDQQQHQQDSADRLSYNPQPHNQFDRFNQNI